MKKLLFWLPALFLGLGFFAACTDDKEAAIEDPSVEVSFALNVSDLISRSGEYEVDTNEPCPEPDNWDPASGGYQAHVFLTLADGTPKEYHVGLIKQTNGLVVTDKIMLVKPVSGVHKLEKLLISKPGYTPADPEKVVFSSVHNTSKYRSHVDPDHLMPMELDFTPGKLAVTAKPIIPVSVLCAINDKPEDFGFAIWGLNFVKVICLNYTVNVPADPCVTNSQDIVGNTHLTLIKETRTDEQSSDWKPFLTHIGSSSDGQRGEICFNDQGNILDINERYHLILEVFYQNGQKVVLESTLTMEQIYAYKCSGFWMIPEGATSGLLHFDLYKADLTNQEQVPWPQEAYGEACNESDKWVLSVTSPYLCEICPDTECPEFLSNFSTFPICEPGQPTPCDWISFGFLRSKLVPGALVSPFGIAELKTPVKKLKKDDKIIVSYKAWFKDAIEISLIPIDLVPAPTPLPLSDELGTQDILPTCEEQSASLIVPEDGCYRVKVEVKRPCCPIFALLPLWITNMTLEANTAP